MPRLAYKTCKGCGKTSEDVGPLSWTRLCPDCSTARLYENAAAMQTKRGPYAEWWAFKLAESVGLAPLDYTPPRP